MADQFYGLTDPGKERQNNEDTFIAQQGADGEFIIACVIDGVGGYSGGEVAAALAREAILQRLNKPTGEIIPLIIDCFNLANERIIAEKTRVSEYSSMACVATLALVDINCNQFYYAHVGDTRLYLLRDETLVKISHDQSFVGFLEESGRLTEDEAMGHPKRNEINQALGFQANLAKDSNYIETGQSPFLPGDLLLLCSDGLTDMVSKGKITAILTAQTSLKDKCRQLIDAANQYGGKDNITAVLVQNNKRPLTHDATMPAANKQTGQMDKPQTAQHANAAPQSRPPVTATKSKGGLIAILSILMLVFLGTTVWQYLQNNHAAKAPQPQADTPVVKPRNPLEIKLQAAIDGAKGHVLLLADTAYPSPVIITKAIQINKDSLLIKAKGKVILQSGPAYKGPAIQLSLTNKNIVLDSLTISGFQTGIVAYNNVLSLKNIRFNNCLLPLQNIFIIPGKKYITGKIPAFKADSLPVTNKTK